MEHLLSKSAALAAETPMDFSRYLLEEINWNNRLIGIKGARGTGKTVLMLQRLRALGLPPAQAAYFSLDDLYFTQNPFSPLVEQFYKEGGKVVFLDEVHKYPGWAREVKNLYDFYPGLRIVFTGSSIIDLAREEGDLSRRVLMYELPGLSFREYLLMTGTLHTPAVSLEDLLLHSHDVAGQFPPDFRPLAHFSEYLSLGYYPFFRENREGFHRRLEQMIRVVVENDLASIKGFDPRNARKLLQLLFILSSNVPFKPNLTQLAQKADIHRNTVLNYLIYLENARLIRLLHPPGAGLALLQKPEKIYLQNTNLAFALASAPPNKGNLRETFFQNQLLCRHEVNIPEKGDFLVGNRYTFEIGGRQKTHAQIASLPDSFTVRDDMERPAGKALPLWMFGLMY